MKPWNRLSDPERRQARVIASLVGIPDKVLERSLVYVNGWELTIAPQETDGTIDLGETLGGEPWKN